MGADEVAGGADDQQRHRHGQGDEERVTRLVRLRVLVVGIDRGHGLVIPSGAGHMTLPWRARWSMKSSTLLRAGVEQRQHRQTEFVADSTMKERTASPAPPSGQHRLAR